MKERPILFSAPMVMAILANEKTQTRRVVRERSDHHVGHIGWLDNGQKGPGWYAQEIADVRHMDTLIRCPFGSPGDRLWVKETWSPVERKGDMVDGIRFAADEAFIPIEDTFAAAERWVVAANNDHSGRWRPSIFMPRWASRITLDVTDVRVQRLHDISEDDARAEGVDGSKPIDGLVNGGTGTIYCFGPDQHRKAFGLLWNAINGERVGATWADNPFVWAISFRRVQP